MVTEKIRTVAMRREVQALLIFGVLAGVGYYMYLKNKKKESEKGF